MVYKILIKPSALRDLDDLPGKEVKNILRRVEQLKEDPRPIGIQKLSHEAGYRIRSGNYRILFEVNDSLKIVFIYRIKHRKDVYKK